MRKTKLFAAIIAFVVAASFTACTNTPPYDENPGGGNTGPSKPGKDSVWVGDHRDTVGH